MEGRISSLAGGQPSTLGCSHMQTPFQSTWAPLLRLNIPPALTFSSPHLRSDTLPRFPHPLRCHRSIPDPYGHPLSTAHSLISPTRPHYSIAWCRRCSLARHHVPWMSCPRHPLWAPNHTLGHCGCLDSSVNTYLALFHMLALCFCCSPEEGEGLRREGGGAHLKFLTCIISKF